MDVAIVTGAMVGLRATGDGVPDQATVLVWGLGASTGLGVWVLAGGVARLSRRSLSAAAGQDLHDASIVGRVLRRRWGRRLAGVCFTLLMLPAVIAAARWVTADTERVVTVAAALGGAAGRSLPFLASLAVALWAAAWNAGRTVLPPCGGVVCGSERVAALLFACIVGVAAIPPDGEQWRGVVAPTLLLSGLAAIVLVPYLAAEGRRRIGAVTVTTDTGNSQGPR